MAIGIEPIKSAHHWPVVFARSQSTHPLLPETGTTRLAIAAASQAGRAIVLPTTGSLKPARTAVPG